jgi:hypothetical protein
VQSVFGTVVIVVAVVGVIGAIAAALLSRRTWDDYGRQHILHDADGAAAERDVEIQQLLDARNALRRRRGEPELDRERELARLRTLQIDPELREEIRQLVVARNHRRARQGKPPLDVEAEIAREIAALNQL